MFNWDTLNIPIQFQAKILKLVPEERRTFNRVLSFLLIFITFPELIKSNGMGLDSSWEIFLHWAYDNNIAFGKDVIFTYGPLGFISKPLIGFQDHIVTVFSRLLLYGLWWMATIKILCSIKDRFQALSYFVITIISFAYRDITIILLLTILTYYFISFSFGKLIWSIPAYFLSASALLVKFNIGFNGLLATILFSCFYIYKYGIKSITGVLSGFAIFFLSVTGIFYSLQGSTDVVSFFISSFRLAEDFPTNLGTGFSYIDFLFAIPVILLLFHALREYEKGKTLFYLVSILAITLFFTFKASFVRGDKWHLLNFFLFIGALSINLLVFTGFQKNKSFKPLIIIQIVCSLWLVTHFNIFKWINPLTVLKIKDAIFWKYSIRQVEQENERLFKIQKLPKSFLSRVGNQTIDAYPWDVGRLIVNNLNYSPNYVVQYYHGINPHLDSLTSLHYSQKGPEFVLMSFRPFDDFHPVIINVKTFTEIWNNYQIADSDSNYLLLEKTNDLRFRQKKVIQKKILREGETLEITNVRNPLFLKAKMSMTILAKIIQVLYKCDLPQLEILYADGTIATHSVPWKNMQQGFLVNNIPRNLNELNSLFNHKNSAHVSTVKFRYNTAYYKAEIPISIEMADKEFPSSPSFATRDIENSDSIACNDSFH